MVLALLLLAADVRSLAVLELRSRLEGEKADTVYLSDQVRAASLGAGVRVITRENLLTLLKASGKDAADCEGECEVETGRRIGADFVVSGEILRFGATLKLNLRLHDSREGTLLSAAVASGATLEEVDKNLPGAVRELLKPLGKSEAPVPQNGKFVRASAVGPPGDYRIALTALDGVHECVAREGSSCDLGFVAPGPARLVVTGASELERDLHVGDNGGRVSVVDHHRAMLVMGATFGTLGLAGLITGFASDGTVGKVMGFTFGGTFAVAGLATGIIGLAGVPKMATFEEASLLVAPQGIALAGRF